MSSVARIISDLQRPIIPWTPALTAGGSQTYTSTTVNVARYWQFEKRWFFSIDVTGTTGGTPHGDLYATIPFPAASVNGAGGGAIVVDSGTIAGFWGLSTVSKLVFRRYDGGNWGAGSGRRFIATGFLELA